MFFFAFKLLKEKKPLINIILNKIEFRIFKEVLYEDKVYNNSTDKIIYYIGDNNIEVNYTRKFKAVIL